jgi:hypothetical protein
MPDEPLPMSTETTPPSEPGRITVAVALERMHERGLPGWVLAVIESYAPGFDPRGVAPYYEEAARQAGGHVHYKSIMFEGKPAYFVILANNLRISTLELQQIMKAWEAWRVNGPAATA